VTGELWGKTANVYHLTNLWQIDVGDPITNLKLQKLLYYAQGWILALADRPLFDDRIEAWPHGPVVPPVYGEFKKWQWNPIAENPGVPELLAPNIIAHLDEIMQVYGVLTAFHLERLTHKEEPWLEARKGLAPDAPCNEIIKPESMRRYFKAQLSDGNSR
jgi:uncharacterized phage-associated protein